MRIFLLGFMCSGKTTLGIALAAQLKMPFVDLDALIESREGCSIPQIFEEVGETGFRYIEQRHLHTLKRYRRVVVSTGGGTPCFFDNIHWMNRYGTTIYLQTTPNILHQRLMQQRLHRPILRSFDDADELLDAIEDMLAHRKKYYHAAKISVTLTNNLLQDAALVGRALADFQRSQSNTLTHAAACQS